jgi:hypothetical protein
MSDAKEGAKGFELLKVLGERRDKLMNALAGVTLRVTSSRPYFVITSALSRPALFAMGASRKATIAATSKILAQMNMPSREDMLTLSQRLTRIEMVLDDLSAAMDAVAAASAKPRVAPGQPQRAAERKRDTEGGDARSQSAAKAG